jgi:hypothetical protein
LCYDAGWTKILLAQKIKSKNKKLRWLKKQKHIDSKKTWTCSNNVFWISKKLIQDIMKTNSK